MGKFWPPSIPEWHATVVGFMAGYVAGRLPAQLATPIITPIINSDGPHPTQARSEAAYTLTAFALGLWTARRED